MVNYITLPKFKFKYKGVVYKWDFLEFLVDFWPESGEKNCGQILICVV